MTGEVLVGRVRVMVPVRRSANTVDAISGTFATTISSSDAASSTVAVHATKPLVSMGTDTHSRVVTHPHLDTHTHTLTLTHLLSLTLNLTPTLTLKLTLTHLHSHAHLDTHSLALTLTHTQTHTHSLTPRPT